MKKIYDPVHGFITLTPLMVRIIDTPEFQRLRDLKQLGATYFVFPSATHTRLEHSIGVSFLAGETMRSLKTSQEELNITPRQIELVEIAGLIHDLGHGPFSHLYDNYIRREEDPEHEERGCQIFKDMVARYNLSITTTELEMIIKMICSKEHDSWLYQIVANAINQIDVDKIDYIIRDSYHLGLQTGGEFRRIITQCRVIDDIICYPQKVQYDIFALFSARYRLHKQVYHHHAVVSYEFIIIKILKEIMKLKPNFLDLTDSIVSCRLHSNFKLELDMITKRKHWRLMKEKRYDSLEKCNKKIQLLTTSPHIHSTDEKLYKIKINNHKSIVFKIHKHTIGFVSGNRCNPLDNIWLYANQELDQKFKLNARESSFIIPKRYQETIMRIYMENEDEWKEIKDYINKYINNE